MRNRRINNSYVQFDLALVIDKIKIKDNEAFKNDRESIWKICILQWSTHFAVVFIQETNFATSGPLRSINDFRPPSKVSELYNIFQTEATPWKAET